MQSLTEEFSEEPHARRNKVLAEQEARRPPFLQQKQRDNSFESLYRGYRSLTMEELLAKPLSFCQISSQSKHSSDQLSQTVLAPQRPFYPSRPSSCHGEETGASVKIPEPEWIKPYKGQTKEDLDGRNRELFNQWVEDQFPDWNWKKFPKEDEVPSTGEWMHHRASIASYRALKHREASLPPMREYNSEEGVVVQVGFDTRWRNHPTNRPITRLELEDLRNYATCVRRVSAEEIGRYTYIDQTHSVPIPPNTMPRLVEEEQRVQSSNRENTVKANRSHSSQALVQETARDPQVRPQLQHRVTFAATSEQAENAIESSDEGEDNHDIPRNKSDALSRICSESKKSSKGSLSMIATSLHLSNQARTEASQAVDASRNKGKEAAKDFAQDLRPQPFVRKEIPDSTPAGDHEKQSAETDKLCLDKIVMSQTFTDVSRDINELETDREQRRRLRRARNQSRPRIVNGRPFRPRTVRYKPTFIIDDSGTVVKPAT
jgi:hypothetical protein